MISNIKKTEMISDQQYIQTQIDLLETNRQRITSYWEVRSITSFDYMFKVELESMIQYIKNNKQCKSPSECKLKKNRGTIPMSYSQNQLLNSSAIFASKTQIQIVREICIASGVNYVVWDTKFHNKNKANKLQLISKLNDTDIVIIDVKDNKKCQIFLEQAFEIQPDLNEYNALCGLIQDLRNEVPIDQNVLKDNLSFLIEQQREGTSLVFNNYNQINQVTGCMFQRVIVLVSPNFDYPRYPIVGKITWVFQTAVNQFLQTSFFKQFKHFQTNYSIDIPMYQRQYKAIHSKITQIMPVNIKYKTNVYDIHRQLRRHCSANLEQQIQLLPFEIVSKEDLQQITVPSTIRNIVQRRLNEDCSICMVENKDLDSLIAFSCCGSIICAQCFVQHSISNFTLKCTICRNPIKHVQDCHVLTKNEQILERSQQILTYMQATHQHDNELADIYVHNERLSQKQGSTIQYIYINIDNMISITSNWGFQDFIIKQAIYNRIALKDFEQNIVVVCSNTITSLAKSVNNLKTC